MFQLSYYFNVELYYLIGCDRMLSNILKISVNAIACDGLKRNMKSNQNANTAKIENCSPVSDESHQTYRKFTCVIKFK